MMPPRSTAWLSIGVLAGVLVLTGCDVGSVSDSGDGNSGFNLDSCTIPTDRLVDGGVPRDGIPSLDEFTSGDDRLVEKDASSAGYLEDDTRTGFEFAARELVQVIPTVGWSVGPGAVQLGARLPVHGQSTRSGRLPASPTATLGYFLSWDDPLWK
ncbi:MULTISPECIES: hypothetical protein [Salinibacter]|uniref:hypothetical protein n=2 Tax=Salinibacteraceae TaxID=1853225 RepID=UPI0021E92EA8|nr:MULTISPECIES: hypothetical protein [Salinibacter]